MKFRFGFVWLLVLLWECTTPPPPVNVPVPPPPKPPVAPSPDDDHRSVTREEFQASPWAPLPAVKGWIALPTGAAVTLADGRELRLTFAAPAVVRWWVPAGPGDEAVSAGAIYPADPGVKVRVKESAGVLSLDSPGLSVRWKLADLSWTLLKGSKTILHTSGGPRASGRRLNQAFVANDAALWTGPGLESPQGSAKFWPTPPSAGLGGFAAPILFGAGGEFPFVAALDNSYQTYSRVTNDEASLGALNGGLDILIASAPQASSVTQALTGLTGRPEVPPAWAHGNALVLPAGEKGTFLRQAKLSVQTAVSPPGVERSSFQTLILGPEPTALPDLTQTDTRAAWLAASFTAPLPRGAGLSLLAPPERQDWDTRFDDGGRHSLLAAINNRLPGLEAKAVYDTWATRSPGLRPFLVAESGGLGSVRWATPEIRVAAGDTAALQRILASAVSGLGVPAVRLDLTALARRETAPAAFQTLLSWLMVPVLILDAGPDPAALWAGLPDADQKRFKAILDRRSQFKPLFAQLDRQAAAGRPSMTPLWFAAPTEPQALATRDEYLLGDGLLVAPVPAGAAGRSVYLPGPGVWFDFWSGEEFGGGKAYDVDAKPDRPLLYARGGAFVPVREAETFDERNVYNPFTVHVFPGGRGSGTYYLDDGVSLGWRAGESWETSLTFDFGQKEMTLDHEAVNSTGRFKPDPYLMYRLHNVFRPKQVKIDGKAIPLFGDSWGITDTDRSAAWYESDHTLLVKTFHPEKEQSIAISF